MRTSKTISLISVLTQVYGISSFPHSSRTGVKSMPSKPSSIVTASSSNGSG